ncbi:MAG: glycoside hydrolase family 43 protein [Bryobacteraceae bacterium]
MRQKPVAAALFFLLILAACSLTGQTPPPVSPSIAAPRFHLALSDFYAHDPFILADPATKTYYLYTAIGARQSLDGHSGVVAYKSTDLKSWDGPHLVFSVPDDIWANPADGAWAPEVHRYRGKLYLFVTLHNNDRLLDEPVAVTHPIYQGKPAPHHLRGTQIFVADSPDGPFQLLGKASITPPDFMALDGTFYVENEVPYMIYAHEWIQTLDGTMEAIRLAPDLSGSVGQPFYLFKGSDAPWLAEQHDASAKARTYVTDGPFLYRTRNGRLLMLWSSYRDGLYMEALAYSVSGKLEGPWRQSAPLIGDDSGHGMLFHTFDNKLMLVLHHPFRQAHAKLYEMRDTGDTLVVDHEWN